MPVTNISEARRAASRANGAKSRGPRTPAGKSASSRNAVRHGLTLQALVLPHECPDSAQQLLDDYTVTYQPIGPVEHEMVEMLALFQWQFNRTQAMQVGFYNNTAVRHANLIDATFKTMDPMSHSAEVLPPHDPGRQRFPSSHALTNDIRRSCKSCVRRRIGIVRQSNPRNGRAAERGRRESKGTRARRQRRTRTPAGNGYRGENKPKTATASFPTPRNATCPCGSGDKFKRCCGPKAPPVLGSAA